LDEASAKLNSLFGKQARASKFYTKAERDAFLRHQITFVSAYKAGQDSALEATHAELTTSRQSLEEIDRLTGGVQEKIEDGRKKVKDITENITGLKEKHAELTEKRELSKLCCVLCTIN